MSFYSKLLYRYKNGNYFVSIYADGTKIRKTFFDEFNPIFPESIDLKITNFCDNSCPMCHEDSSVNGTHANLNHPFLTTLKRGTELAIGGGNPLSHPKLNEFLNLMKIKGVICNMTVNESHFIKNKDIIQNLIDKKLIYGLGISLFNKCYIDEIISFCKTNRNTVIHLIAGIVNEEILTKLKDNGLKILILGYKNFGRGINYFSNEVEEKIHYLKENLKDFAKHFKLISFDNLAIVQMKARELILKEEYEKYYMGDDGSFTMYIDLVKEEFGVSSISTKRFNLLNDIVEMFDIVKQNK